MIKTNSFFLAVLLAGAATASAQLTTVFSDNLASGSTINSNAPIAPTGTSTSYEELSAATWSPNPPTISSSGLKYGIVSTSGAGGELQALFVSSNSPVKLTNSGDYIQITVTFSNSIGLLTQESQFAVGLFNSGGSFPIASGVNSNLKNTSSNLTNGGAAGWNGYIAAIAYPQTLGGSKNSEIISRPPQSGTGNNNQVTVVPNTYSTLYGYANPNGTVVGSASTNPSVALVAGGVYTATLTFTRQANGSLTILANLYTNNTSGTLISTQTGTTGATPATNSFDAFSVGFRSAGNVSATTIFLSSVQVTHFAACTPAITGLSPSSLTNGVIGLPYSQTISATGGSSPYTFSVASGLPPGLSINSSSGLISGTPTNLGTYNFTVMVGDSNAGDCVVSSNFSITVNSCITAITGISPAALTNALYGSNYSQTITPVGGTAPYTFVLTSNLPPGLNLDINTGIISGTSTAFGTYNFSVTITDSNPNDCTATTNLSISVLRSENFDTAASTASDGWIGFSNLVGNLTTPTFYGWMNTNFGTGSAGAAGGLIGRVVTNANYYGDVFTTLGTYNLSNTLVMNGNFNITVLATNEDTRFGYFQTSNGVPVSQAVNEFGIYFNEPHSPGPGNAMRIGIIAPITGGITESQAPFFIYVGTNYSWTWVYSPAPAGTNHNGSVTLTVLGTVTNTAGGFSASNQYVFNLPNAAGTNSYNSFGIVNPGQSAVLSDKTTIYFDNLSYSANCAPISLSPSTLPDAIYGASYSQTISASGGTGPYAYVALPALPPGLGISTNGVISGTPTTVGTYNFTVMATDSSTNNAVGSESLTLVVDKAPVQIAVNSSANPALPGASVTFTATVSAVAPNTGTPTGTATFLDGTNVLGSAALDGSGVAAITNNSLSHNTHTITAQYGGDGNFLTGTNSLSPNELIDTPPVAGAASFSRPRDVAMHFNIADLLTNDSDPDGDVVSFTSVGATSTNGATVGSTASAGSTNGVIYYTPPVTNGNVTDAFTYTIQDSFGLTASGTVTITILPDDNGPSVNITGEAQLADGTMKLDFAGIPGRNYLIQATTNLSPPITWTTISTNTAGTNGLFEYIDLDATNFSSRYYRTSTP